MLSWCFLRYFRQCFLRARLSDHYLAILFLIFFSFSQLYSFSGYGDVFQVSEGREGVVLGAMIHDRTPISPLRHQEIIPSKPILSHLVGYWDYRLRGQFDEQMLRTASVLGGTLLATVLFSRVLVVSSSLLLATLAFCMLFFSYGFQRLALDGRVDMFFNALLAAGLLFAGSGDDELDLKKFRRFSRVYLAGVIAGAAVLTKGPLGLVLSLLILSFYWRFACALSWRFVFVTSLRLCLGAGLVFLPWYILQWKLYGYPFLKRQILFENLGRLRGVEGITEKPFWFYFPQIFLQWAPWSFILFSLLVWFFFRYRSLGMARLKGIYFELSLRERRLCQLAFFWIVLPLILFSISSGKRRGYLLTVLPAFSIIGAFGVRGIARLYCTVLREQLPKINRILSLFLMSAIFLLSAIAAFVLLSGVLVREPVHLEFFGSARRQFGQFPLIAIFLIFLFIFWLSRVFLSRPEGQVLVASSGLVMFACRSVFLLWLFFVAMLHFGMAVKGEMHSYKQLAYQVRNKVLDFPRMRFIKESQDEDFDTLFFYLERPVRLHSPEAPLEGDMYYLARKKWFTSWSDKTLHSYRVLLMGGRVIDPPENQLILFYAGSEELKQIDLKEESESRQ
ncbi:MAG: hypothetical protein PHC51_10015 [bacterium]|nr:hypothetical protein [bacterium]